MLCCIAAAAAKSLQSCPTLCDPIDGSPPGSAVPGILQARTLEWVAISFSNAWKWKVKVKSLSRVRLFKTPWNAAPQAILMSRWQNSSPRSCLQASGSPQLCPGPLPVHVFHVLSDPTQSPGFTVELINVDLAFRCVSSCLLGSSTCVFSSLANLGVQKHTSF